MKASQTTPTRTIELTHQEVRDAIEAWLEKRNEFIPDAAEMVSYFPDKHAAFRVKIAYYL